ncbi:hypothetical protein [Streptomyces sp. KL116D]|uniref:hypothetical protein n=1 Tax=Streptomyces sp. KL116D TaxID=3045152 RepID=UPI0035576DC1
MGTARGLPLDRRRAPSPAHGVRGAGRRLAAAAAPARRAVRGCRAAPTGPVSWFGGGPGEAYPDTRAAARLGRWTSDVDALRTPHDAAAGERGAGGRPLGRDRGSADRRRPRVLVHGPPLDDRAAGRGRAPRRPRPR